MRARTSYLFLKLVTALATCTMFAPASAQTDAGITVADMLSGADAGFERAREVREFVFPDDHGPHPDFQTEWWYYTGNIQAEDGRRFGFQLTFFRFALSAERVRRPSAWATNQVYMAHFAVTDVAADRFVSFERFSRGALGLAGARSEPYRVWLEDWEAKSLGEPLFPLQLRASEADAAIELELHGGKPVVLQGDRGLSRKSAEPGNASYYYSITRMAAEGRIRVGGNVHVVTGTAWLDREWGTSALASDQVGWDWFALQLSDGYDLMFYQLRRPDGRPHEFSAGGLVDPDGTTRRLHRGDVQTDVLTYWESPVDGTRYPGRWMLWVLDEALELEIVPHIPNQEMNLSVRYWEGAVRVKGRHGSRDVTGSGYVELTGYASTGTSPGLGMRQSR